MKEDKIKLFMMNSGEIVVAEVIDAGPEHFETNMPSMLVTEAPNEQGKSQVGLAPYCPYGCLLYTSPSPRDLSTSRMPSSA